MCPDGFSTNIIGAHSTDVSVGVQLLTGESLLKEKNPNGRKGELNPDPCK